MLTADAPQTYSASKLMLGHNFVGQITELLQLQCGLCRTVQLFAANIGFRSVLLSTVSQTLYAGCDGSVLQHSNIAHGADFCPCLQLGLVCHIHCTCLPLSGDSVVPSWGMLSHRL